MSDIIRKTVEIAAPLDRVWEALTDSQKFGEWFRVSMEGPFRTGEICRGRMTFPGAENMVMEIKVESIEPKTRFAYFWRPYAVKPDIDYSKETPTLVEFILEPMGEGVRLTVTESGFENVPEYRRAEALQMNTRGWTVQVENIKAYAEA